jgi:two-component system, NtrC family, C4-dicarboxylate transport sensor histidine kinase DctB
MKDPQHQKKISEVYAYAEFGKLSSGLFHDLINPFTALSLHLDSLAQSSTKHLPKEVKEKISATLSANKRMWLLIAAMRKHLTHNTRKKRFSVSKEISNTIELLSEKACKERVSIDFSFKGDFYIFGHPLRFYQVISNLISNAIDSYKGMPKNTARKVRVAVCDITASNKKMLKITVQDNGSGIAPDILGKIFDPFFTTKTHPSGIGIGLATAKEVAEQDLKGHIQAKSAPAQGALFIVTIPLTREASPPRKPRSSPMRSE